MKPRLDKSNPQMSAALIAAAWANGGFEVIYARRAGDEPSFAFEDSTSGTEPLRPGWRGQAGLDELDLIATPSGKGGWKAPRAKTIQSGVNFTEAWAIPDTPTWWVRSEGAAALTYAFMDSDKAVGFPVAEGGEYRVRMLAAAHRCRAEAVLRLTDRSGRVVQELRKPVSPAAKGGRDADAYDPVEIAFRVPAGATRLQIDIDKGGGAADGDSFLFVTKPSLRLGLEETPHAPLDAHALAMARQAVAENRIVEMAWLPMAGRGGQRGDLVVQSGSERQAARGLETPASVSAAKADTPPTPLIVSSLKAALTFNRKDDADGRHAHALRLWLGRAEAGEAIPDLEPMRLALLHGVTGATGVSVKFPAVQAPAVSVVLISSGDAEVDRLSQAALRFAACRASFEVIIASPRKTGLLSGANAAIVKARADHIVLLPAGLEPVAGWLDELLAVFANFDGVAAAGAKVIEHDGRLASAGLRITPKGRLEPLGHDGNPRDPMYGFVRPVDAVSPVMLSRAALEQANGLDPEIGDAALAVADLSLRCQQQGGRVLYAPTAELWRLKGVDAPPDPAEEATSPFRMRWAPMAASAGWRVAHKPLRVLFVDQEAPTVDMDAGGYAAFQEIRLLQALGASVTFLPKNLAWMDRHTIALQRAGVECLYAPFTPNFEQYLQENADAYDVIFVLRYKVATLVQEALAGRTRKAKLVLNLADLHFLREIREAAAGTPGFDEARARETQAAELAAIAGSDLTMTYSDVEAAVIESHTMGRSKVARTPWVVETREKPVGQPGGAPTMLFLGGFGHPPNAEAVKAFVRDCLPAIHERLPGARLIVVGSKAPPDVLALASPHVEVRGYVPDLDAVFAEANMFVAPLIAGAGLKGKVIEALSRGMPTILSPIAAEGTGLIDGADCLMAEGPADWAAAVERLHGDPALWRSMAEAALAASRKRFSFEGGVARMREALAVAGVYPAQESGLHYRHALPDRSNGASAAPAVLPTP